MLNTACGSTWFAAALHVLRRRIDQPEITPSAQVVDAIREHSRYFEFADAMSNKHIRNLQTAVLSQRDNERFRARVRDSLEAQAPLDAEEESFEGFVAACYD